MEGPSIPVELLEQMHAELPEVGGVGEPSITKHFSYEGRNYAIRFYKVKDKHDGAEFWLFNPYNVIDVITK